MGPAPSHLDTQPAEDVPPPVGYIESDRKCLKCGYSLHGLKVGSDCPECGYPTGISTTIDDPLSLMPIVVIRRLKWGCWAAFWCMMLTLILVFVLRLDVFPQVFVLIALAGLAIFWQVTMRLVIPALDMPQAIIRGFSRRGKLRLATHWLQLGWLVVCLSSFVTLAVKTNSPLAPLNNMLLQAGMASGIIGLILLSIMLERLSDWTRDNEAKKIFNLITWCIPLAVVFSLWGSTNFWISLISYSLILAVVVLYPMSLLILARSISYCVHHAVEHELRMERQQEKRERFFSGVVEPYIEATSDKDPAE